MKYNSAGAQQWVSRYNGPVNSEDRSNAVAVDSAGNVLVTGSSYGGSGANYDYATVKYNSAGTQQWVSRYNGPVSGPDTANAVVLDSVGNVLVTGESYGSSGPDYDYATVKYNSAGAQQWVSRYNGPGNGTDYARAMVLDSAGNVLVTGASDGGSGTSYDYATVKYNSSGTQQWVSRYNGPGNYIDGAWAIAVDSAGSVLVTGYSYGGSGTGDDYATVKYNSAGIQQWVVRYAGAGNATDIAYAVAVDSSGGIRVAGTRRGTVNNDFGVVAYDGAGTQLWANATETFDGFPERLGGSGGITAKRTLVVDAAGNTYVTALAYNGTNEDFLTHKFTPDGNLLWSAAYNGPGNGTDTARALALDSVGNVVVTGQSRGSGTNDDYATVKYSGTTGALLWVARYNGPMGSGADGAQAVVVDGDDNVIVTGFSTSGSSFNWDYATVKYSSAGEQLWAARYERPGSFSDVAQAVAVDSANNVIVTGNSTGSATAEDYATVKYARATGAQLWEARYNGPGNSVDRAFDVAVDSADNVLVTGESTGSGTSADYATVKYAGSDGAQVWVSRYNGPPGANGDSAFAVAVDSADNVLVTGQSVGSGTGYDYATLKYAGTDGAQQWEARYSGPGNDTDRAHAVAVDSADNVLVTGQSRGNGGTSYDYATLKYAGTDGTQVWSHRYEGSTSAVDGANAVAVAPDGALHVGGTLTLSQGRRIAIVKLREVQTSGTVLFSIAPSPSTVGESVTLTAHVSGAGTAPADGSVVITASTGETCTASTPAPVDADTSAYACAIVFATSGTRSLTAAFTGSATHQDSSSDGSDTHHVRAIGTVVFGPLAFTYDGTTQAITAHIDEEPFTACVVTPTTIGSNAGTYPVTAVCDGIDYIASGSDTASIAPRAATVTADAVGKTYGEADPALTYSVAPPLVSGDSLTGALTRASGENAGVYAIAQGTLAASSNYTVSFNGADFTITPRAITVTANAAGKTYGEANPALTYTVAPPLVNGDNLTGALSRVSGENVGTYAITQDTLAASGNYTLSFTSADFTITPLAITVTANATSKTYGEADPALTYSVVPPLVSGDSLTGALTRAPGENAGVYAIAQGTLAANGNYTLSFTDADFTIHKAAQATLTAIANPTSVLFGETSALSTTGGSGTGAVSYAATTGAGNCGIAGATLTGIGLGTCTVTATKAADVNYLATAATVEVNVTSKADLQLAKDANRAGAMIGDTVVFTLVAANAGPNDVTGTRLVDVPPATLVDVEWACVPAASSIPCPAAPNDAGEGAMDVLFDLPTNQYLRYDLVGTVAGVIGAEIQNSASLIVPAGVTDPTTPNSASASVLIVPMGVFADGFEQQQETLAVPGAEAARRQP